MKEVAAFTRHGGALDVAQRLFPNAPTPWLDLSTGVNPIAYGPRDIPAAAWQRLPDEAALHALEIAAGRRYRAPPGIAVVAAPGTQALIQRLPELCDGHDVRVLGRTYGEFERVFHGADRMVRTVPHIEALSGADIAVIVNPNNPDGRMVPVPDLVGLSGRIGTLIVDEAFADALSESQSAIPRLPAHRTFVLRSFGKFYGLAGLRLGFAVLPQDLAIRLRRLLGPWPVSGPAVAVGATALADDAWWAATRHRLAIDSERLTFVLRQIGATSIGGTPLFQLVAHPGATALFAWLARAGILTRPFDHEPSWLRFGIPGNETDWTRLQAALRVFR